MAKQTWTTDDGKTFDTKDQALAHEKRRANRGELARILDAGARPKPALDSKGKPLMLLNEPVMGPDEIAGFLIDQVPTAADEILAWGAKHKGA